MPRFTWNDPKQGRLINRYIDMICREYPKIARGIVKNGIGDLGYWFRNGQISSTAENATCGCLVGTTALVAMKQFSKTAVEQVDLDNAEGAIVLYNLIVAESKRDVSKYTLEPSYDSSLNSRRHMDPLFLLIIDAGMAAADETELLGDRFEGTTLSDDEYDKAQTNRRRQVIDHIELRIRQNLNIPFKKVRR